MQQGFLSGLSAWVGWRLMVWEPPGLSCSPPPSLTVRQHNHFNVCKRQRDDLLFKAYSNLAKKEGVRDRGKERESEGERAR